jgi:tRNA uridine 5-carbamoylmethylation protein Kti12
METTLPSHPISADEFVSTVLQPQMALIMRGAPGSGKSTVVAAVKDAMAARSKQVAVASADAHRMVEGRYVFDPKKNDDAHAGCLRDFIHSATVGDRYGHDNDVIICDNTNVNVAEIAPYWAVARAYGWQPLIVYVETDPEVAAKRNIHGVPDAHVHRMAGRIREFKLPGMYRQLTVRPKEAP